MIAVGQASGSGSRYPRQSVIARTIQVARNHGVDVKQIEIAPDGTVRVGASHDISASDDIFDQWDRSGRL